ncbi:MAG: SPFH domain-containing protein [Bacteroidales bacterium]|jgi:membrane protease subunit (stomatin/prohibitin family)|nr:SPFH domain-containing protein [Bacteroidales bacterium]
MGLFSKIKGEFIDIIEWLDPTNDTIIHRFERYNNQIKYGAKLTVRESQVAVFVNEGQIADVFAPGMYTLETQNIPILSTLKGWKYGFNSPFLAEVYFINTKNFTDKKWGTKNPIMMRDAEFGMVRLRAFGNYTFRVGDPAKFIKEIAGTDGSFTSEEIEGQIRDIIITRFTDYVAEAKIPVLDLASNYNELSKGIQEHIKPEVAEYGINITKFLIENISLPPEVEAMIDKRSSMGIVGDLNQFTKFQTANAIEAAANNPSGDAGAGMGMGMGFAMANQMAQSLNQQPASQQQTPPPMPPAIQYFVAVNGQQTGPFTLQVLQQMVNEGKLNKETLVWTNGMPAWAPAGTVDALAAIFQSTPPPMPPQL